MLNMHKSTNYNETLEYYLTCGNIFMIKPHDNAANINYSCKKMTVHITLQKVATKFIISPKEYNIPDSFEYYFQTMIKNDLVHITYRTRDTSINVQCSIIKYNRLVKRIQTSLYEQKHKCIQNTIGNIIPFDVITSIIMVYTSINAFDILLIKLTKLKNLRCMDRIPNTRSQSNKHVNKCAKYN